MTTAATGNVTSALVTIEDSQDVGLIRTLCTGIAPTETPVERADRERNRTPV